MAQAATIKDFLTAVKTTLVGLSSFAAVWKTPGLDVVRLLKEARFPAALVTDMGGNLDPHNKKLWYRRLAITIVVDDQRDNMGDYAQDKCLDLGETVKDAFKLRTDLSLSVVPADDAVGSVEKGGTIALVFKTYYFSYELQTS